MGHRVRKVLERPVEGPGQKPKHQKYQWLGVATERAHFPFAFLRLFFAQLW